MADQDTRWVTGEALTALAAQGLRAGGEFTSGQLRTWSKRLRTGNGCAHATGKLIALGFVTAAMRANSDMSNREGVYTVTEAGAEAIKAAGSGYSHRSGPKVPHGHRNAAVPGSFAQRLWALLRARRMLDSDTAAQTLTDAGDDADKAAQRAARYFSDWHAAGAVQPSAQRLPGGCKRWVLVRDSVHPPSRRRASGSGVAP